MLFTHIPFCGLAHAVEGSHSCLDLLRMASYRLKTPFSGTLHAMPALESFHVPEASILLTLTLLFLWFCHMLHWQIDKQPKWYEAYKQSLERNTDLLGGDSPCTSNVFQSHISWIPQPCVTYYLWLPRLLRLIQSLIVQNPGSRDCLVS